ncbi:hypothetical protein F4679DRAFT_222462 [Xylaria curta]|nr:hypothetical protein F4679DRAFT_222462 [Xylaria curta]
MAAPQNRKRPHVTDHLSQDNRPKKKPRSSVKHSNFSPRFWDSLSRVPLTSRALRELDRRHNIQPPPESNTLEGVYSASLAQFARHGGPDLHHLRGYPGPNTTPSTMPPSGSTKSTDATSKKSSASSPGPEFEQHLIDHSIYPEGYEYPDDRSTPEPGNMDQIRQDLSVPRASLSPSRFPESEFRSFKRKNTRVVLEDDVMDDIIPILCGNTFIPHKKNILFTELKPITNEDATRPKPDFFDGSPLGNIDKKIRDDKHMYSLVVPTKHLTVPVVPNFFLEAKRQDGSAAVMKRQACYDGAYGARAMHGLQNYGEEIPTYNRHAYTFSSTYHAGTGTLQLYAHHSTAPTPSQDRPEYHMTQLDGYQMTGNPKTFVEGATAFRNARDLAKQYRDGFAKEANSRARQIKVTPSQAQCANCSRSSVVLDSANHISQEAHDALQSDILNQSFTEVDHSPEEDSDGSSQTHATQDLNDLPVSFATTSSTSSSDTSQAGSKHSRQLHSPPLRSTDSHLAKRRPRLVSSRAKCLESRLRKSRVSGLRSRWPYIARS